MTNEPRRVSRSTVVAAPPEKVFDLLADARRHNELDGSGTVKGVISAPDRLALGSKFSMRMRIGLPYPIRNRVTELEENRLIAWRHFANHTWRYELAPVEAGTRITETFDWSTSRWPKALELGGYPAKNAVNLEKTMTRLEGLFGTP